MVDLDEIVEKARECGDGGQNARPEGAYCEKREVALPHQAQSHKVYCTATEVYDGDFPKKYNKDLNTTLVLAGLFSVVTTAFIVKVNSKLQPDPNVEAAALFRVFAYTMDNTTFGKHVPTLPQWTGPPPALVHVQAILYASLVTSLFSTFLAMLCKQWLNALNRYNSIDMRRSAIERSQGRRRKAERITAWYFDRVVKSLSLMLQVSLLLLCCALSRYLWEIDATIASAVLGVTSFGVLFHLFVRRRCQDHL